MLCWCKDDMNILILFFTTLELTESAVIFTYYNEPVKCQMAKSRCEALGQKLAVLDTEGKLTALRQQNILSERSWIGYHDQNRNDKYYWLNGKYLADDDDNWDKEDKNEPSHGNQNCGSIITSYKWRDHCCSMKYPYICEQNVSCVTLISGNEEESLVEDSTDYCSAVPQSTDGLSVQYELSVNSACGNGTDFTVHVTVDNNTDCNDLVSVLSVKELDDDCSRNSLKMKRCLLIDSVVDSDERVCRLRCKCADSADSCLLQIYSRGLLPNPPEIKICEIEVISP